MARTKDRLSQLAGPKKSASASPQTAWVYSSISPVRMRNKPSNVGSAGVYQNAFQSAAMD